MGARADNESCVEREYFHVGLIFFVCQFQRFSPDLLPRIQVLLVHIVRPLIIVRKNMNFSSLFEHRFCDFQYIMFTPLARL